MTAEAINEFISASLTANNFEKYIADPARVLMLAEIDGVASGYSMLLGGEPADLDARAVLKTRPTVELSKFYVVLDHHGAGLAAKLMAGTLDAVKEMGGKSCWLGVNQLNAKANRFYEKSGFAVVGTKRFLVGDQWGDDFVREMVLK